MLSNKQGPITNPEFWDEKNEPLIPTPVEATTAPAELRTFNDVDIALSRARYDELARAANQEAIRIHQEARRGQR